MKSHSGHEAALNPIHCTYNVRSLSSIFLNFSKYFSESSFFQLLNACQKLFFALSIKLFFITYSFNCSIILLSPSPRTRIDCALACFLRLFSDVFYAALLFRSCGPHAPWHGAGQLMSAVFPIPVIHCLPLYRILSACQGCSAIRTHFFETKQGKLSLSAVCFFVLCVFCAVFPFRMSKPHNRKGATDANPSALLLYFSVFAYKKCKQKNPSASRRIFSVYARLHLACAAKRMPRNKR